MIAEQEGNTSKAYLSRKEEKDRLEAGEEREGGGGGGGQLCQRVVYNMKLN